MHRSLAALVAVALALLVLACGSGAPAVITATAVPGSSVTGAPAPASAAAAAPSATVGKVGDRIEANGVALTVLSVKKADSIGDFQKAASGNIFVIAEVVIENAGADKAPYNPLYFSVKDGDGFEYNVGISTDAQALKSGDLATGEKARGTVVFEVKKAAKSLVLNYKPLTLGSVDPIKVSLP